MIYLPILIIFYNIFFVSLVIPDDQFYAYYTKLPSNFDLLEDYQEKLFGKYSDLIVKVGEKGNVVFSRNTSYLPVWQTDNKEWSFPESVTRQGDGPQHRPDILSKYSHVRLIKQSADTILIHWRYFSDMNYVELDGVIEEYYKITPDLKVIRSVQEGTVFIEDWKNRSGKSQQIFQLSGAGISLVSELKSSIYIQEERAYYLNAESSEISFSIDASVTSPIVNPAFVIKKWDGNKLSLRIDGMEIKPGKQFRFGSAYDTSGQKYIIVWLEMYRENSIIIELGIKE